MITNENNKNAVKENVVNDENNKNVVKKLSESLKRGKKPIKF